MLIRLRYVLIREHFEKMIKVTKTIETTLPPPKEITMVWDKRLVNLQVGSTYTIGDGLYVLTMGDYQRYPPISSSFFDYNHSDDVVKFTLHFRLVKELVSK